MTRSDNPVPRRRRKEARPSEIVEAGLIQFAAHGYAGTTMTQVAERAGLSKGLVYHYFAGKEALFRAVFRSRFVDALALAEPLPIPERGPVAPILRLALREAYLGLAKSDALALIRILLVEGGRFPDLVRDCRDDLLAAVAGPLRALIDRGIAQGELAEGPYRDLPLVLFAPGAVIALAMSAMPAPKAGDGGTDRTFDAVLDVMMQGLLARPGLG